MALISVKGVCNAAAAAGDDYDDVVDVQGCLRMLLSGRHKRAQTNVLVVLVVWALVTPTASTPLLSISMTSTSSGS